MTQHRLAEADTGLVDIGWTGRMAASLIGVSEAAGMSRPHILFWGHEPRAATGWTDPERVGSFVYNTATGQGLGWRVPDAPFVMETFCMGDHGIVMASCPGTALVRPGGLSLCCCRPGMMRRKRGASAVQVDVACLLRGARGRG